MRTILRINSKQKPVTETSMRCTALPVCIWMRTTDSITKILVTIILKKPPMQVTAWRSTVWARCFIKGSSTERTSMKRKNGSRGRWVTAINTPTLSSENSVWGAICSENFVMKASTIYSKPSVTVASLLPIRSANILWRARS